MTLKRIALTGSAILGALLLGAIVVVDVSPSASLEAERLQVELDKLEKVNAGIRARNDSLDHRAAALRSNPDLIEHAAREDLGFIREGEVVVVLPK
ncbi:MAG: septum formation initiator family protein [Deltaproteobacteria bacterium]|nr:septum formation initiator family protein [Deltaproteobacteria bacterium]